MNATSLTHRQIALLPEAVVNRHSSEFQRQGGGVHADQNRRRGDRRSRGGRQGERNAWRREAGV